MTRDAVKDMPATGSGGLAAAHALDLRHTVDLPSLRRRTSDLLLAHVPLTLLLDLADPAGLDSVGRYTREGGDVGWLHTG